MNIMSMLVRLQGALGSTDLIDQVILLPERRSASSWTKHLKASGSRHPSKHRTEEKHWQALAAEAESRSELNLVVGYNSSPKSQTALDLTLWIAHQTRLATRKQVTVQVVYVVDPTSCLNAIPNTPADLQKAVSKQAGQSNRRQKAAIAGDISSSKTLTRQRSNTAVAVSPADSKLLVASDFPQCQTQQFEQADRILWQARCLANEWRGSLKTHLRFGNVAQELKRVVEDESATLLWLGCDSPDNAMVQKLGSRFPCPVLGVPPALHPDRYFE